MKKAEKELLESLQCESTQVKALAIMTVRMSRGPLAFDFAKMFNEVLAEVRALK